MELAPRDAGRHDIVIVLLFQGFLCHHSLTHHNRMGGLRRALLLAAGEDRVREDLPRPPRLRSEAPLPPRSPPTADLYSVPGA